MSTQPEALLLAYECEQSGIEWRAEVHTRLQAAAHIRRLVAENEALREDLRKFREAASCERDLRQEQERHATALVRQMLEALVWSDEYLETLGGKLFPESSKPQPGSTTWHVHKAITAAREWLGQKGETG